MALVAAALATAGWSGGAETRCALADRRIGESSGVASASWSDDVVFTHNDSGDVARFFAVDARTCATRATYTVTGATNVDWEDMARSTAADGTPVLWLGDIGDNQASRTSVVVYEVAEPGAAATGGPLALRARWALTYPDGPHDAETLLVDPETGRPVVVTKDVAAGRSRAYRVPPAGSGVLEPLTSIDLQALPGGSLVAPAWSLTGGATSPDRRTLVLRTYLAAWSWPAAPGEPLAAILRRPPVSLDVPLTRQPEAVSFTRDGAALWLTSEGIGTPLQRFPLDAGPGAAPATAPPSDGSPAPAPAAPGRRSLAGPAALAAGAVLLVGALGTIGLLARRRRP